MKQTTILKMVAQNFGLSAKDVLEDWLQDGWLKLEDVQAILPEIVSGSSKVRHNQSKRKELKKSDICNISDLKENVAFEPTILCGMAKSEKIEVGMFYYNKDKTFSKELIKGKHPSGVVCYVDKTGHHGLILALREKRLPWSSEKLWIDNMPEGLSGKENTSLIIKASQTQRKKAEAAEYCANYAYDGIKAGEAFLPSKEELEKSCPNKFAIKNSLKQIKKAQQLGEGFYWSSSPNTTADNHVWQQSFDDGRIFYFTNFTCDFVRPMLAF